MNMSYCRFQNTLIDLRDCRNALNDLDDQRELKLRRDARAERIGVLEAQDEVNESEEAELDRLIEILNEEAEDILSEDEFEAMEILSELCKEMADQYAEESSDEPCLYKNWNRSKSRRCC